MRQNGNVAILAFALAAAGLAQAPNGWKMRGDRRQPASHATNPQAAVYWNPANTASGSYTVNGTFTLMKPSGHTNYYGLVFGGNELDAAQQQYLYFLVAQNGTFLIKRRNGEA